MDRKSIWLWVFALSIWVTSGCEPARLPLDSPVSGPPVSPGHARMLERLERVRQEALQSSPHFQQISITSAEVQLQGLKSLGPESEYFQLEYDLARDYRRIGEHALATMHFASAARTWQDLKSGHPQDVDAEFLYQFGLTWLRRSISENSIYSPSVDSCILPVAPQGVLLGRSGAPIAIEHFRRSLELRPDDLRARWLINLSALLIDAADLVPSQHRLPSGAFNGPEFPGFTDVAFSSSLRSVGCAGGVVVDDFNTDGLLDVMVGHCDPSSPLHFARNTGAGIFYNDSEKRGLGGQMGGRNLVQADFDNDGFMDVLILRGAGLGSAGRYPLSLLRNVDGRFTDVTYDVGLGDFNGPAISAAWADFDNDGDLDLYIAREIDPCTLFRNDGSAGFVNVADAAGVTNDRSAFCAVWGDFDGDRWPDLYVTNTNGENRLYRNQQNGTFRDVAQERGVTGPRQSSIAWFWDFDNDGRLDIFCASNDAGIEHTAASFFGLPRTDEPDHLYRQREDGRFENVAAEWGVTAESQPLGGNFGDLDNDGYPDFYLATGAPGQESMMPNVMYHNRAGQGFDNVTFAGGFGHFHKGSAVAFADIDNDGDLEVCLQVGGDVPGEMCGNVLYSNPGFGHHWLRIRLAGVQSNRAGVGARIRADFHDGETRRSVYHWMTSGGSFGANPLEAHVGLASATKIDLLEIYWPSSDTTQQLRELDVDQRIEIQEGQLEFRKLPLKPMTFRRYGRRP